ncbi:hypothetical protein [Sphingobacterium suaedae]|uniref:DoxX family protein n=1 Tax=Sphingobacterium suaedae TaxID=1686402 RepID=A0ABW5KMZ9_9SPHI
MKRRVSLIQGYYYVIAGVWPVVHRISFLQVTGGKQDLWLVELVGLLSVAIGLALIIKRYSFLGFCTALAFTVIDLRYAGMHTSSPAYLIDAVIQLLFMGALIKEAYQRFTYFVLKKANRFKNTESPAVHMQQVCD